MNNEIYNFKNDAIKDKIVDKIINSINTLS